ncbi:nucleolar protein 12 isoform X2 [Brachyhypopomus gauderio]|uniref:nucleolar protein 12 isoform X2 n=1 Tax=Brachyhypopomus gauderio TaxID=698409 RepID=UPI0040413E51
MSETHRKSGDYSSRVIERLVNMVKKKWKNDGKLKSGSKIKPGSKKRENKCVVTFDDKDRQEFLTGFHKRKLERRKAAVKELETKLREERKRVREERHKEYVKMFKERKQALEDADELEDVITATTESVHYDHPNHTVTVTTISDLDLSNTRLLENLTSNNTEEDALGSTCPVAEKYKWIPSSVKHCQKIYDRLCNEHSIGACIQHGRQHCHLV